MRDPRSMPTDELKIRADEARMCWKAIELALTYLDHIPQIKAVFVDRLEGIGDRVEMYEKIIEERMEG